MIIDVTFASDAAERWEKFGRKDIKGVKKQQWFLTKPHLKPPENKQRNQLSLAFQYISLPFQLISLAFQSQALEFFIFIFFIFIHY